MLSIFKRRNRPLLLLSALCLLSFSGFAAFVWLEPLGDTRVGTSGPSASNQLPEPQNQDGPMPGTKPEESLTSGGTSGGEPAEDNSGQGGPGMLNSPATSANY